MYGIGKFVCMIIVAMLLGEVVAKATPPWAKSDTQIRNGNAYIVVCSGTGPAVDTARAEAMQSCKSSALAQMQTSARVKSVTIETESDIAFHQEVSETLRYKGLNCIPLHESVEQTDVSTTVWLKCKFDLAKARVSPAIEAENPDQQDISSQVSNKDTAESMPIRDIPKDKTQRQISSDQRVLSISSIPQCTTLLIRGNNPRVVKCNENPMAIVLMRGDREIIVRADRLLPKTLNLKKEGGENYETINVFFDPQ